MHASKRLRFLPLIALALLLSLVTAIPHASAAPTATATLPYTESFNGVYILSEKSFSSSTGTLNVRFNFTSPAIGDHTYSDFGVMLYDESGRYSTYSSGSLTSLNPSFTFTNVGGGNYCIAFYTYSEWKTPAVGSFTIDDVAAPVNNINLDNATYSEKLFNISGGNYQFVNTFTTSTGKVDISVTTQGTTSGNSTSVFLVGSDGSRQFVDKAYWQQSGTRTTTIESLSPNVTYTIGFEPSGTYPMVGSVTVTQPAVPAHNLAGQPITMNFPIPFGAPTSTSSITFTSTSTEVNFSMTKTSTVSSAVTVNLIYMDNPNDLDDPDDPVVDSLTYSKWTTGTKSNSFTVTPNKKYRVEVVANSSTSAGACNGTITISE